MSDDREYIPVKGKLGLFEKNPNFTGSPHETFKEYKVELLVDFPEENYKTGDIAILMKMPNSSFYLKNDEGLVFYTEAEENVHFKPITPSKKNKHKI